MTLRHKLEQTVSRSTDQLQQRFQHELLISLNLLGRFGAPTAAVQNTGKESLLSDGFTVSPITISRSAGYYFAAQYAGPAIYTTHPEFETGGMGEALRNVSQHGHSFNSLEVHQPVPQGIHGAIARKVIQVPCPGGDLVPVLLASVMDSGPGISDPAHELVDGIGNIGRGEQHKGLGYELKNSLVYVIRSREAEWFLFDGVKYADARNWPPEVDQWAPQSKHARIEPVGRLDVPIPSPAVGCQKIFFGFTKTSSAEQRTLLRDILLETLSNRLIGDPSS